jgi:hypothetical protein
MRVTVFVSLVLCSCGWQRVSSHSEQVISTIERCSVTSLECFGGQVAFGTELGRIALVGESSSAVWSRELGHTIRRIIAYRDSLIVVSGSCILSIDRGSGSTRWAKKMTAVSECETAGDILVYSSENEVIACSADTGSVLWTHRERGNIWSLTITSSEIVVITTHVREVGAIALKDGREKWRFLSENSVQASLVECGGRLWYGDANGLIEGIDAITGRKMGDRPIGDFGRPISGLISEKSRIYVIGKALRGLHGASLLGLADVLGWVDVNTGSVYTAEQRFPNSPLSLCFRKGRRDTVCVLTSDALFLWTSSCDEPRTRRLAHETVGFAWAEESELILVVRESSKVKLVRSRGW